MAVWKAPRAKTRVYGANVNEGENIVKRIVQLALSVTNDKFKIRILCALEGVRVPMASAILTMADPTKYGVIDVYAWYSLKGKAPKYLNTSGWLWYLQQIHKLAIRHGKTPREIDKALWQHGYYHLSKEYRRTGGICPICRR